jgi:Domain of unknown function (DUF5916)
MGREQRTADNRRMNPVAAVSALLLAASCGCVAAQALQAVRLQPGERITLDGSLSHPAWQRAPAFSDFVEQDPSFGEPPPQATSVQVLFDDNALYVGVTLRDTEPERIVAPLVRPDQVNRTQDFVSVYLDAIGTGRSAQLFRVNAAGSRTDGLHTAADDEEDLSPDFDWDAAVSHNAQGWTAVLRLPLASLRFAAGVHDWRIMVVRRLPRERFHLISSVLVAREAPSLIHQLQALSGITLPEENRFVTLRPGLTWRRERAADGTDTSRTQASLDAKWRLRPEALVDMSWNPDFSQVDLDVPQLSGNTRFALFFPEKRPFFFESADLLRSPTEALYTRSYTVPRWGLRGTWRDTRWAGTALLLSDRGGGGILLPGPFGTAEVDQPASRSVAVRARNDGGPLIWGGLLTARDYGPQQGSNTVAGPDLAWQIDNAWRLRGQWLRAWTSAQATPDGLVRSDPQTADRRFLRIVRQSDRTDVQLGFDDIERDFRNDSGFTNQAGVRKWLASTGRRWDAPRPFNQIFSNLEWERVSAHGSGQRVSERLVPGLRVNGPGSWSGWVDAYVHSQLRTGPEAPLLRERYVAMGLSGSPARWFPRVDLDASAGRLADTADNTTRPGGTARVTARLRPLARLELDVSASSGWLRGGGTEVYRETAWQDLGIWHFNARHSLRAIVERSSLQRVAQPSSAGSTGSLTYSWRESAGSTFHLGWARERSSTDASVGRNEVFLKLQFDVDEARGWW